MCQTLVGTIPLRIQVRLSDGQNIWHSESAAPLVTIMETTQTRSDLEDASFLLLMSKVVGQVKASPLTISPLRADSAVHGN